MKTTRSRKKPRTFCSPKGQTRANYVYRQKDEGCPFRVCASLDSEGDIEIKNSALNTSAQVPLGRHARQQMIGPGYNALFPTSSTSRRVLYHKTLLIPLANAPELMSPPICSRMPFQLASRPSRISSSVPPHGCLSRDAPCHESKVHTDLEASFTQGPKMAYFHRVLSRSAGMQKSCIWGRGGGKGHA